MSEEQENDGTWGGLKKTIIGTISTLVLGAGTWAGTMLFGGEEVSADQTPQQVAAPIINLSVDNSSTNSNQGGGTTTIIKEVEKPAAKAPEKKKDEFAEEEPLW